MVFKEVQQKLWLSVPQPEWRNGILVVSEIIESLRRDMESLHTLGIIDDSALAEFDAITSPGLRGVDADMDATDPSRLNCPHRTPDPSQ
jgi:hypothetical protein